MLSTYKICANVSGFDRFRGGRGTEMQWLYQIRVGEQARKRQRVRFQILEAVVLYRGGVSVIVSVVISTAKLPNVLATTWTRNKKFFFADIFMVVFLLHQHCRMLQDFDGKIVKIYHFPVRFFLELLPHCSNRVTCRSRRRQTAHCGYWLMNALSFRDRIWTVTVCKFTNGNCRA